MNHPVTTEARSYYPHKYSFIDKEGNVVIDASKYQSVRSFSDGLAAVWLTNRGWGFIDKTGTLVIDTQYQSVLSFSEGLAAVQLGEEWGFIDKEGQLVIEPQYASVNSFSDGIAVVVRSKAKFETDSKISAERHLVQSSLPSVEVKTTVRSRSDLTAPYVDNQTSIEVRIPAHRGH